MPCLGILLLAMFLDGWKSIARAHDSLIFIQSPLNLYWASIKPSTAKNDPMESHFLFVANPIEKPITHDEHL
jgi:hypothetical protein